MKTIFDPATNDELVRRISMLHENSKPAWGKMTVYQMLKHCTLWEEMYSGDKKYKRMFLGRLFGRMIIKKILKDEKPMRRNSSTMPGFVITGQGDFLAEKEKWIAQMKDHRRYSKSVYVHPFFGKMTKEEIGYLAFKHIDHHLRQFNC